MEELTGFQRDLMYVIANNDEPSGQNIRRSIEPYYNGNVNHGRLYPNLDTLVEDGFVVKGSQDQRTNFYKLTQKGKDAIVNRQKWENKQLQDVDYTDEVIEQEPVTN